MHIEKFPDNWLFQRHTRQEISMWVQQLQYFYFKRAWGGHSNDGDEFQVAFTYYDRDDLINKLEQLGLKLNRIPEDFPRPVLGKSYEWPEFEKFKNEIKPYSDLEQPGITSIFGHNAFIWVSENSIQISVSGTKDGNRYEVTNADFETCLIIENHFTDLSWEKILDKSLEENASCISRKKYPELYVEQLPITNNDLPKSNSWWRKLFGINSFIFIFFLCTLKVKAQLPVHQEPFHPPVFQNKQVRILNAKLPPGDTTQYHLHHTPSVFIFLTKTTMVSQLQGKAGSISTSKAGSIIFENLAAPNDRVHRVINIDKDTLHVLDLELISNDTGFAEKPLIHPNLQLEIDNAWARAYRLTLAKTNDIVFNGRTYSYILVSLDKAIVQVQQHGKKEFKALKRGSFIEIKSKDSFSIKNASASTVQFALVELPQ